MRGAPAARLAAAAAARTSRRVRLVFGRSKANDSIDTPPCWLSLRSLARNVAEEGAEVSAILKCRTHTKGLAAHARPATGRGGAPFLSGFQRDVLIGPGIGKSRDQPKAGFSNPRPVPVDEGELPDWCVDRALVDGLLHLFEDRTALLLVELSALLFEHLVEIGIAAISVHAARDRHLFEPGRRVAERTAAALDQVSVLLLRIAFEKRGAFERLQPCADADLAQIVDDRLAEIGVGRVAIIFTRVEAVRMTRLPQKLHRLFRVVDRLWRLPIKVEAVGHKRITGQPRIAEGQRLVDAVAIHGEAGGTAYPLVMPWRFLVPLIGEGEPEGALNDRGLQRQPRRRAQLLGQLAADRVDDINFAPLQRGEPRRLIGDATEHQTLDAWGLAPIAVESFQRQLDTGVERHEFIRAGADRRLLEPVLADLLDILFRHDPAGARRD